jgi:cation diffusion facilitator family transporter
MKHREHYRLPESCQALQDRARRLAWWSIVLLGGATVTMYFVMGSSQAMKTAWMEDVLSLVPPIAYLIATRVSQRPPNQEFPYGYQRAISIAFLCSAIALLAMGGTLLVESVFKLVTREHPTIQSMQIGPYLVWQGWPMVVVLTITGIIPVVLGRLKLPIARRLHDKALHADADMNKADWLTALAAIGGVLGVALGQWWSDAAAAAFISIAITHDGVKNLRRVVLDLMDRRPTNVEDGGVHEVTDKLAARLRELPWVAEADVRLREEGHLFAGEAFIVPKSEDEPLLRIEEAKNAAGEVDWRLSEVVVTLMKDLALPGSARSSS